MRAWVPGCLGAWVSGWVQWDLGAGQVRYEVHFNVQGTGFDGTIKRGACTVPSTLIPLSLSLARSPLSPLV